MLSDLRIAVVGAGRMGADHIRRITERVSGAVVSAIVEPEEGRAAAAQQLAPGAVSYPTIEHALSADVADAMLIATPGQFHERVLVPALRAGVPILCEKPLTPDPESARRILDLEQTLDRPRIQVGFMRRFDAEYQELRALIRSRDLGDLLMLRCAHRNPGVPDGYTQEMLITDSVVHEFDVVPWLAGADIRSVQVRYGRRNSFAPERLREPILVLMDLANGVLVDVEMNASAQFGYQVATEAVFEKGLARIGQPSGMQRWSEGRVSRPQFGDFTTRFADAYDEQVQRWVDAARDGRFVDGPNAWDGYRVAEACAAGVAALRTEGRVALDIGTRPDFYG
ncbi:Gfo/Idh/MocA family protein [Planctomonas psychrotolerans]|uniref:Gfo/Idh/MocA family protein n=1 Tax=Planctomonas psychrotolerans TaxID=2528712 RepID=UPI00123BB017|nr:Gfo/Idh/MocA family oxidoreductase [Planctomonas psychrotolerans]